jgi:hypothetical protein
MNEPWVAITAAVAAGVVTLLASTFSGLKGVIEAKFAEWRRSLLRRSYAHGLGATVEFTTLVEQMKKIEAVDRVLVFVGQDSGGLPKAGKPYTVRAHIGWSNKVEVDVLRRYNYDLQVDTTYGEMLLEMVEKGVVVNTTEEMPDSFLKTCYRDEGVVQALVYFIDCDGSQLTFLSVANYRSAFTPEQKVRIELLVGRLRALMGQ